MKAPLVLGPDVVERLIPHRRPLLMVDGVVAYERAPRPRLWATRHVAANEPVFEGHFPGLHLWPGVYTIEGLGQTCTLLFCVQGAEEWHAARGGDPDEVLDMLRNLELGFKLAPGYDPDAGARFLEALASPAHARTGMSAHVDVKLLAPVFAGQRIDYSVVLTHVVEQIARFDVEAEVDGKLVAKGVMSSTRGIPLRVAR